MECYLDRFEVPKSQACLHQGVVERCELGQGIRLLRKVRFQGSACGVVKPNFLPQGTLYPASYRDKARKQKSVTHAKGE